MEPLPPVAAALLAPHFLGLGAALASGLSLQAPNNSETSHTLTLSREFSFCCSLSTAGFRCPRVRTPADLLRS